MLRVHLDIKVGLRVDVLDLVDPWFQFSILEDRKGIAGRVQGHGQNEHDSVGEHQQAAMLYIVVHIENTCRLHFVRLRIRSRPIIVSDVKLVTVLTALTPG